MPRVNVQYGCCPCDVRTLRMLNPFWYIAGCELETTTRSEYCNAMRLQDEPVERRECLRGNLGKDPGTEQCEFQNL